ncbi:hypothetical protein EY643_13600 [Halioglobus maricola]|uniref:Transmembrane protein (PGPGW) n=1 Tax=Halioglobus maricola TaxID=2601894 RepID=A0A5P9NLE7_9GAMM|nr:PGPGW domain-containing protein [Halioglobus maricola]QFU76607.1 hypothetical protein EY643_13600 [Halioglobus maricola]
MDIAALLPQLLVWVTVLSGATFLAALVAVPWVVKRLPQDYFSRPQRLSADEPRGVTAYLLAGLKNLFGAILVLLGILLLFTPGQGLLTLLAGLLLMNFPGKYRLERAVVARKGVFRALNWMRQRQGLPDFDSPRTSS